MKTPRELILQEHRTAEPALQKISAASLAACAVGNKKIAVTSVDPKSVLFHIYAEMIAPWRKIWLGLGFAWLLVIFINTAVDGHPKQLAGSSDTAATPETLQMLAEQRRILAQLIDPPEFHSPADIPRKPGPRSDASIGFAMV